MPFGYTGQNQPNQKVKNEGVLSSFDVSLLEKKGQAGGSLELIEEINASGTSNIEFTSINESIYNVHFMTLQLNCTGTYYTGQFYEDGIGWETSSVYQYALQDGSVSGGFGEPDSTASPHLSIAFFSGTTNPTINGYSYFYNLGDSSKYSFQTMHSFSDDGGNDGLRFGGGVLPQASKVTGIRLLANGTTTSTGTVKLYGVKQL